MKPLVWSEKPEINFYTFIQTMVPVIGTKNDSQLAYECKFRNSL
jgi:hypothetical protein